MDEVTVAAEIQSVNVRLLVLLQIELPFVIKLTDRRGQKGLVIIQEELQNA